MQRASQPPYRFVDMIGIDAAVPEDQPPTLAGFEAAHRKRYAGNSSLRGAFGCDPVVHPPGYAQNQVQARLGTDDLSLPAEFSLQRGNQPFPTLRVEGPHAPDVSGKQSLANESRQRPLIEHGRKDVGSVARRPEGWHEILWDHQIAHAECRKEDLAECAQIDHSLAAAQTLQGVDRRPAEAILAVVVIL